jgi:hypothetical protein
MIGVSDDASALGPRLSDGDLSALYRDADAASLKAQRLFFRATTAALALSVVAAAFGAVESSWAGYGAALAFVGALAATVLLLRNNPERAWYDGRAVAESAKTLAWQYAVGGGDFPRTEAELGSDAERAAQRRLVDALAHVRRGLGDVAPVPQGPIEHLTQSMQDLRASDLSVRCSVYLSDRIADQTDWYAQRSRTFDLRRVRWGVASASLQAAGVLAAFAKAADMVHLDLLGVAATAAVAAGGWLRAKDYSELSRAYAVAASELGDVRVSLIAARDEAEWAVAVRDAESAISREHTRWAARKHLRLHGAI